MNKTQTLYNWYDRALAAAATLPKGPEEDILFEILINIRTEHDLLMFVIKDAERLIKGEN